MYWKLSTTLQYYTYLHNVFIIWMEARITFSVHTFLRDCLCNGTSVLVIHQFNLHSEMKTERLYFITGRFFLFQGKIRYSWGKMAFHPLDPFVQMWCEPLSFTGLRCHVLRYLVLFCCGSLTPMSYIPSFSNPPFPRKNDIIMRMHPTYKR